MNESNEFLTPLKIRLVCFTVFTGVCVSALFFLLLILVHCIFISYDTVFLSLF